MYGRNTSFGDNQGVKLHIGGFAYLLGFIKPVDLVKEYDRLSVHPRVRPVAELKTMYEPSGEFTEVLGFFESLA